MTKKIRERLEGAEDGFTLIELLVVVIIIGILAAIAIPTFLNQRQNGWTAAAESDARNAALEVEANATSNNGAYPADAAAFAALPVQTSPDVTLGYAVNATRQGFCVTADHAQLAPGQDAIYDSTAGGLQTDGAAACTA